MAAYRFFGIQKCLCWKCYLIFQNWLHVTPDDVTVTFWQTAIYIVYKLSLNYPFFKAIAGCPLDSSSSRTTRQHIRSVQRRAAHRTGCGPIVQISSPKTSGLQIRRIWTQWTTICGVQCWKLTASLKQSRRQSLNSSKRFRLSGPTGTDRQICERLLKATKGLCWSWRWTLRTFTVTMEFWHLITS